MKIEMNEPLKLGENGRNLCREPAPDAKWPRLLRSAFQHAAGRLVRTLGNGVLTGTKAANGATASTVQPGNSFEFDEHSANTGTASDAVPAISTNSTGKHIFEMAVIPPNSLLEDYLTLARQQVESADSYIIGAFLPVVAACLARRVYFAWGEERIYPNLFAMLAGKSGDRKSTGINWGELLAKAVLASESLLVGGRNSVRPGND
jgi:hypothetical protein